MRRMLLLGLLALVCAGCGPKAPTFESEDQELAYLQALSNPTPEQWKRRNFLKEKFDQQEAARIRDIERESERTIEQDKRQHGEKYAMKWADSFGNPPEWPHGAIKAYQAVINGWPDSPEAKRAKERIEMIQLQLKREGQTVD
jgi:outer membrane protein assembly factor BamD (BamD/ComL family)